MNERRLEVIHGRRDMIEALETMLEKAKAGELDAVAIATVQPNGWIGSLWSYKEDTPFVWARLYTSVASLADRLMSDGLKILFCSAYVLSWVINVSSRYSTVSAGICALKLRVGIAGIAGCWFRSSNAARWACGRRWRSGR